MVESRDSSGAKNDEQMAMAIENLAAICNIQDMDKVIELLT